MQLLVYPPQHVTGACLKNAHFEQVQPDEYQLVHRPILIKKSIGGSRIPPDDA